MDATLRPMSTSQVLDRTFSLYRHNFLLFAGIAALPPALLMLGQMGFLAAGTFTRLPSRTGLAIAAVTGAVAGGIALLALWLIGYALATGASIYAVSRVHLGYQTSIREAYRLVRSRTGSLLGIVVLVFVMVGVVTGFAVAAIAVPIILTKFAGGLGQSLVSGLLAGLAIAVFVLAVIVAVLYLSAKFSLAVPACVVERYGVIDSLKRSWALTTGSVLRLILVNFLAAVMSVAIGAALSIPYFIGIMLSFSKKDPSALLPFVMWQYFADFLARSLAFPIATIAVSLIYYDERVRKEAFDLQLMMEAIGKAQLAPLQPVPASDTTPIG